MSVGAKTGSTSKNVDRWLCGFTPYYTATTWFGYDINETVVFSGNPSAKIWAAVMKDIHKELPGKNFERPSNIVSAKICMDSGCVATEACSRVYTENFVKGTVPGECEGHPKLKICKETEKIANEYCKDVEERTFLTKPEKERDTKKWQTADGDKYTIPTETCDVHKKPVEPVNNTVTNSTTNTTAKPNNNTTTNTVGGGTAKPTEKVTVPDLKGKTLEEARTALKNAGLTIVEEQKADDKVAKGKVISQGVEAGKKVDKGTKVKVVVSTGPATTPPPATNTTTTPQP